MIRKEDCERYRGEEKGEIQKRIRHLKKDAKGHIDRDEFYFAIRDLQYAKIWIEVLNYLLKNPSKPTIQ